MRACSSCAPDMQHKQPGLNYSKQSRSISSCRLCLNGCGKERAVVQNAKCRRFTGIVWAGLRMLLWYPLLMLYAGDVLAKIQFYLVQSKQVCYTACARTAKFHAKLQKKPVRILD